MFEYFELEIIEEIRISKSKVSISFDRWGSKCEKLSVISVVIHIINAKGENVTCLIRLPELPRYSKTGVSKYFTLRVFPLLIITSRSMYSYPSSPYSIWYHISEPRILCP